MSLGFLSLLRADQEPPIFSLWLTRFACSLFLWFLAFTFSRCSSSFARKAVFALTSSFASKSGLAKMESKSFSIFFIWELSL